MKILKKFSNFAARKQAKQHSHNHQNSRIMTKKIFLTLALMLLTITTMTAQSLLGTWKADDAYMEKMELTKDGCHVDLYLDIKKKTIDILLFMNMTQKDGVIDMSFTIPGTYKKKGKNVFSTFDKDKTDLKVTDLQTEDPEMKAMMQTEESKQAMLTLVNSMMKSQLADALKDISALADIFEVFTIDKLTAKTLDINALDEEPVSFTRTK